MFWRMGKNLMTHRYKLNSHLAKAEVEQQLEGSSLRSWKGLVKSYNGWRVLPPPLLSICWWI